MSKMSYNNESSKLKKIDLFIKLKNYVTYGVIISFAFLISILVIYNKDINMLKSKGDKLFLAGEYENAINQYNNNALRDKFSAKWDVNISQVYSVQDDIEKSQQYINKAKEYFNKDSEVDNSIIFTEFMNGDYEQALIDGENAIKEYKNDKQLKKTMYLVYMANNKFDKAKELIDTYPYDKTSSYDMAEYAKMLMISGQWDKGYNILKDAWTLNKDEIRIYDVLSQVAIYNKDKILEDISEKVLSHPEELSYKMWLLKLYSIYEETTNEAKTIIEEIKNEDAGKIQINVLKASILFNEGNVEEAKKIMDKLINDNKEDYSIYHAASWFYLKSDDINKALEYCNKSIKLNPRYPDNYAFLMPEILMAQKKYEESKPYFRMGLSLEPFNHNIMLNIGNYYWDTTNNSEKTIRYFKLAEIIKPDDTSIKYNMALIYLSEGKNEESINLLKKCIDINEAVPEYHRTLGTIYMLLGKTKEAIEQIRFAYHADEEDILNLNNAGCYYISVEGNVDRGYYNFLKAFEGINDSYDEYIKSTITDNYNKAKKIYEVYHSGKENTKINVPDFILFY